MKRGQRSKKRSKKGQAAMEFLMTYGWAILVFILAVGALTYLGVLNSNRFLPDACIFPAGIACKDFKIQTSQIQLILANGLTFPITLDNVEAKSDKGDSCYAIPNVPLESNEQANIIVSGCDNGVVKGKYRGVLNVSYTVNRKEFTLQHSMSGVLRGKIEAASTFSVVQYCQNAETGGVCPGLDLIFGAGYCQACIDEHNLCVGECPAPP
jgi:hypothetical protein